VGYVVEFINGDTQKVSDGKYFNLKVFKNIIFQIKVFFVVAV